MEILYVITLMFVCTRYILSCLLTLDEPLSDILIMMSNIIVLLLNLCHALNLNVM